MKQYHKKYDITFKNGESVSYTQTEYVIMKAIEKVCITGMPIECDIKRYYKNKIFKAGVINDSFSAYISHIIFDLKFKTVEQKHRHIYETSRRAFEAYKEIYKAMVGIGYYNPTSLSLYQMIALQSADEIAESVIKLKAPNKKGRYFNKIQNVYDSMEKSLEKLERGPSNTMHSSFYGGLASENQFKQMYGVCGYSSNLVNEIAKQPVLSSYVSGLNTTTELVLGAKSAVIATYFSITAIKSAEYYSRRIQTAISSLKWVSTKDCGTTDGLTFTYQEDGMMLGMYFKYNQNEKWQKCTKTNKPKEGDVIILRNINHCNDSRGDTCCIKCAGDFAYHKPKNHNYGMWMVTKQTEVGNQHSLSVKHYLSSAVVTAIFLKEESDSYIMRNNAIYLSPNSDFLKFPTGTGKTKSFSGEGAIRDSLSIDIKDMDLGSVSKISTLHEDNKGKTRKIEISQDAFLSREVLDFIRKSKNNIVYNGGSSTIINLKGFDKKQPILKFIALSVNYKTLGEKARALVVYTRKGKISIGKEELFQRLIEVYNPTMKVNYSIIAAMLYTQSINYDVSKHDSRNTRLGIGVDSSMTSLDDYLSKTTMIDRILIGSDTTPLKPHERVYSENSHSVIHLVPDYENSMELLSKGEIT